MVDWALLSTHGLVLISVDEKPEATTRQLAGDLMITERSVQRVVSDLVSAGYVKRRRIGRRNRYYVNGRKRLRHPIKQDKSVDDLLTRISR